MIQFLSDFFAAPPFFAQFSFWAGVVSVVKIIAFVLSLLLAIGIIYSGRKIFLLARPKIRVNEALAKLSSVPKSREKTEKEYSSDWTRIIKRTESGLFQDFTLAIIEADNLVDEILKNLGYPGGTLGERLKQIDSAKLRSLDDLWEAHKVRNNIVHTPNFKIAPDEARKVLERFQKVFKEMGAI